MSVKPVHRRAKVGVIEEVGPSICGTPVDTHRHLDYLKSEGRRSRPGVEAELARSVAESRHIGSGPAARTGFGRSTVESHPPAGQLRIAIGIDEDRPTGRAVRPIVRAADPERRAAEYLANCALICHPQELVTVKLLFFSGKAVRREPIWKRWAVRKQPDR